MHGTKRLALVLVTTMLVGMLVAPESRAAIVMLTPTQDTRLVNDISYGPQGGNQYLSVFQDRDRTLLQFDLSSLPDDQQVESATLTLFKQFGDYSYYNPSGEAMNVYRVTRLWDEASATWFVPWSLSGGDFAPTVYATSTAAAPVEFAPVTWDVTALVSEWYEGAYPNYGMEIKTSGTSNQLHFFSSEYANPTYWPRLTVEVVPEPGTLVVWSLLGGLAAVARWRRRKVA